MERGPTTNNWKGEEAWVIQEKGALHDWETNENVVMLLMVVFLGTSHDALDVEKCNNDQVEKGEVSIGRKKMTREYRSYLRMDEKGKHYKNFPNY